MKKNNNKTGLNIRGFTLVEFIVYMGIFSVLLLMLTRMFTSTLDTQLETESISNIEQDTRFIFMRLNHDVQAADNIIVPETIGSTSSTLQLTINGLTNIYALNDGNITLTNNNGTNVVNNYDTTISNLSFLRLGNTGGKNTITVSFTITGKTVRPGGTESKDFRTTMGTR